MKDTVSDTSPPFAPATSSTSSTPARLLWWVAVAGLLILSVVAVVLAYQTHQRLRDLERELVLRQQTSQDLATEARALARQAQDSAREAAAKAAVLETRLAEVALQRDQLDDLLHALARSRDENVLIEIEAGIRMAMQQAGLTGSVEPLLSVLKSADERLQRLNQPRLERVRRAIAQDIERVRAVAVADVPTLVGRLDEAARLVDELPLLSSPGMAVAERAASDRAAAAASAEQAWPVRGLDMAQHVWRELRSLVRVTRIDQPEAMLIAPEQTFFLRENLKLRLLNARLALLSRQFDTVQADVRLAQQALDRYFDPRSRRVMQVADTLRQVQAQAHAAQLPRPDQTLSTLQAAAAGR
jgi:uroporphyrin-3 C-methyltransferase